MDFTFILTALTIGIGMFFSLFLFFGAENLSGRIEKMGAANRPRLKLYLRCTATATIILCTVVAGLILPRTPYGKTLTGNYSFSKFIHSQSREDADRAFRLWQQAGNRPAFIEAFDQIPKDSPVWKDYLKRSAKPFSVREGQDDILAYLHELESKLEHPQAKSALHFELGCAYQDHDNTRAEEHFRMVVSLDNDQEYADRARGNIHEIHKLQVGSPAPDFAVTTITGQRISLADLQGKVVLLEFWSRNCTGCVREIPLLKKIYADNSAKDFAMVSISLDHGDEVLKFITDKDLTGQHVMVEQKVSTAILDSFNIQYLPTSYVLDREGKIAFKKLRGKQLEEAIAHLLKQ